MDHDTSKLRKFLNRKRKYSSSQIIMAGFAIAIFLGCFLLMLPCSTKGPGRATFMEALFTSTSAVCVTGLVVQDTATYWSVFGQTVILLLIQVGGMGVVTMAAFVTMLSGKRIGLMQRSTMQEALAAPQVGGIVKLTAFILKLTAFFEVTGALILAPSFVRRFGVLRGIRYAIFHSVSAFCNAGFDLMGVRSRYSSLTSFSDNVIVNVTIMLLIIIGGIGFLTWEDVMIKKNHFKRYRMQTKVILTVTGLLLIIPAVYFYFWEFSGLEAKERILCSMFQSVTPRTAGFNTADLTKISEQGIAVMILLMLVGGSPGSTAGGMKTTTIAVLAASAAAVFRRRENAHFFGRRIQEEAVRNAAAILLMYLTLFLTGGLIISRIENLPLGECLFETASAIGTVGLTLGITPGLGVISRLILIGLMFFGRVGGLTIIFAAVSETRNGSSRYPQEKITVG